MMRMKREFAGTQNQILPAFDSLLLLDRNIDLLTPLATQLTYEGLIDEIYGITNGLNKTLVNFCFWGFFFLCVCSIYWAAFSLWPTGYVKLPPEKFAEKKQGEASKDLLTERKKLQLNSAEELYAEIRDKNFNAVGAALSKKAKIISAAFEVSVTSYLSFLCEWITEWILFIIPQLGNCRVSVTYIEEEII